MFGYQSYFKMAACLERIWPRSVELVRSYSFRTGDAIESIITNLTFRLIISSSKHCSL